MERADGRQKIAGHHWYGSMFAAWRAALAERTNRAPTMGDENNEAAQEHAEPGHVAIEGSNECEEQHTDGHMPCEEEILDSGSMPPPKITNTPTASVGSGEILEPLCWRFSQSALPTPAYCFI